jgi:nucleobase:cation symporter-1, NCS1 family
MYFGGQAWVIILNSIFPSFLRLKNTLPERSLAHDFGVLSHLLTRASAGITTTGLIGFVLFIITYFPIIIWIPAWRVQKLLEIQIFIAAATLLGIMGWAVAVSLSLFL